MRQNRLGAFVRCRARGPQTGTPAAKRLVAIRRLRAGQDGGLAGLRRLERDALVANGLFRCASSAAWCGTARLAIMCSAIGRTKVCLIADARAARQLSAVPGYFAHVTSC